MCLQGFVFDIYNIIFEILYKRFPFFQYIFCYLKDEHRIEVFLVSVLFQAYSAIFRHDTCTCRFICKTDLNRNRFHDHFSFLKYMKSQSSKSYNITTFTVLPNKRSSVLLLSFFFADSFLKTIYYHFKSLKYHNMITDSVSMIYKTFNLRKLCCKTVFKDVYVSKCTDIIIQQEVQFPNQHYLK